MKTVTLYGTTDDIAVLKFEDRKHEIEANPNHLVIVRVMSGREGIILIANTSTHPDDCPWTIGVTLLSDGRGVPNWPIRMEQAHRYSPALTVEAPDDATVEVFDYCAGGTWEELP